MAWWAKCSAFSLKYSSKYFVKAVKSEHLTLIKESCGLLFYNHPTTAIQAKLPLCDRDTILKFKGYYLECWNLCIFREGILPSQLTAQLFHSSHVVLFVNHSRSIKSAHPHLPSSLKSNMPDDRKWLKEVTSFEYSGRLMDFYLKNSSEESIRILRI